MKPGVMIYFGDARVVEKMTDAEAGMLFRGILNYAEHGVLPPFADGTDKLGLLWVHFQQSVDADSERYVKVAAQKKYARYCGIQRACGEKPVPFAEWIKMNDLDGCQRVLTDVDGCQRVLTDVDGCQRVLTDVTITNTNNNTNSNSSTSSNTSTNSKLSSNRKKDKKESPADILKAEYEAAFGGGPSDLSEWMYICDNYSPDAIRKVMREAKDRGMKHNAAWAYVSTKVAFED